MRYHVEQSFLLMIAGVNLTCQSDERKHFTCTKASSISLTHLAQPALRLMLFLSCDAPRPASASSAVCDDVNRTSYLRGRFSPRLALCKASRTCERVPRACDSGKAVVRSSS